MAINSLFFNYDKLAKDGVIETIDWQNPPNNDDDENDDDAIRTIDSEVNDVNDKIKRSDDIANDLKRTIDTIKQTGKVSQEDRASLEAFAQMVDVKGLPSMESYTVAPSRVNYDKTLTVSMEINQLLVAGGIAAIIMLICKIFGFIGGSDDSDGGGGGGAGAGGSKQKKEAVEKLKQKGEKVNNRFEKIIEGVNTSTQKTLRDFSKLNIAALKADIEKNPTKHTESERILLNIVKYLQSHLEHGMSHETIELMKSLSEGSLNFISSFMEHKIKSVDSVFMTRSLQHDPRGIKCVVDIKKDIYWLGQNAQHIKKYLESTDFDVAEANRVLDGFKPIWFGRFNVNTGVLSDDISSAKKLLLESLDAQDDKSHIQNEIKELIDEIFFGKWMDGYYDEHLQENCRSIGELGKTLKNRAEQMSGENVNSDVKKVYERIKSISITVATEVKIIERVNNRFLQFASEYNTLLNNIDKITDQLEKLNKHQQ